MHKLSNILIRPVVTEKSSIIGADNIYSFIVSKSANKHSIKLAIKKFYSVDVVSVNTSIVKGKVKRFGKSIGSRSDTKKAMIKIKDGQTLPIWGGEE